MPDCRKLLKATPYSIIVSFQQALANVVGCKPELAASWYAQPEWWTAIFTFALFVVTSLLWIFTRLLWEETKQAVKDTGEGLKIAANSAQAAGQQAKAAITQADIAEKAFFDLERPYIMITQFKGTMLNSEKPEGLNLLYSGQTVPPTDGSVYKSEITLKLQFTNFGKTPAIVEEICFENLTAKVLPNPLPYNFENLLPYDRTIGTGDSLPEIQLASIRDVKSQSGEVLGAEPLYLFGYVRYQDVFGYTYLKRFAYRYIHPRQILTMHDIRLTRETRYSPELAKLMTEDLLKRSPSP